MEATCEWSTVSAVAGESGLDDSLFLDHQTQAGATYMRTCGAEVLINMDLADAIIAANT